MWNCLHFGLLLLGEKFSMVRMIFELVESLFFRAETIDSQSFTELILPLRTDETVKLGLTVGQVIIFWFIACKKLLNFFKCTWTEKAAYREFSLHLPTVKQYQRTNKMIVSVIQARIIASARLQSI